MQSICSVESEEKVGNNWSGDVELADENEATRNDKCQGVRSERFFVLSAEFRSIEAWNTFGAEAKNTKAEDKVATKILARINGPNPDSFDVVE